MARPRTPRAGEQRTDSVIHLMHLTVKLQFI